METFFRKLAWHKVFPKYNLQSHNCQEEEKVIIPIKLTYCKKISNKIKDRIRFFIHKFVKNKNIRINTIFTNHNNIGRWLTNDKHQNPLERNNVIYEFKCGENSCPARYIGETSRRLEDRVEEHVKGNCKPISAIFKHCHDNNHRCDIDNFKIIRFCNAPDDLTILESLYIKSRDPNLNCKQISHKLFTMI